MTIQCAAGDSGNFLVINYGLSILYDRAPSSYQGDIKALHWAVGLQTFPLEHFRARFYTPGLLARYLVESDL